MKQYYNKNVIYYNLSTMLPTFLIFITFLQRFVRKSWSSKKKQIEYHTLSEYCNDDKISKTLLLISGITAIIYGVYRRFSLGICLISLTTFGTLFNTDCYSYKKYCHYIATFLFVFYSLYLSYYFYVQLFNLILIVISFNTKYKSLCFICEWIFTTYAIYTLTH